MPNDNLASKWFTHRCYRSFSKTRQWGWSQGSRKFQIFKDFEAWIEIEVVYEV